MKPWKRNQVLVLLRILDIFFKILSNTHEQIKVLDEITPVRKTIGEGNGNPLQFLAWRIPGTGEPGGLPSLGSHRVGHD